MTEIYEAIEVLNANNITKRHEVGDNYYNCWGFTEWLHHWSDRLIWQDRSEHSRKLDIFTRLTEQLKIGDIAVFHDWDRLTHTATICAFIDAEPIFLHKPGGYKLIVEPLNQIYTNHNYYGKVKEYRRVI